MYIYRTEKCLRYYEKVIETHRRTGYSAYRIAKMKLFPVRQCTMRRWIFNFVSGERRDSPDRVMEMKKRKTSEEWREETEALQKRVKDLEARLLQAEIKAEFYDEMINVAEAKFKIPIRKKSWRQTVGSLHARDSGRYPVGHLCGLFGVSKQAYYQYDDDAVLSKASREEFALQYVKDIRGHDPGMGFSKIWEMNRREFACDRTIGRDRFCRIARENGQNVRKRVCRPRTTDSAHGLPVYPNLIKEYIPSAADRLWVDITYIVIIDDDCRYHFCYLSMIQDAYSEEIFGWSVGPTLDA